MSGEVAVSGGGASRHDVRRRRRRHRRRRARRRADEGVGGQRPSAPRCSAASAASPGCSTPRALKAYRRPLLATSTDGVGTKVAIAQRMDIHDTIGIDLVAMVVDDLVVCGAEPLFLTDYIATGKVVPERIAAIVARHRRGLPAGRLRARRRRDRRAPRAARARRVRRRRRRHRRRRGRRAARPRPGPGRRRARRDALVRAALQRLLAGPPRAAHRGRPGPRPPRRPSSAARSARSCSSRPGSTPSTASSWPAPTTSRCTPSATSPAAGWPPTWPGCSPPTWRPTWTARPGPRSRSSASSDASAASRRPSSSAPSTWASAWWRWWPPRPSTSALARLSARGLDAWVVGAVRLARTARRATLPPRAAAAEPSR